MMRPRRCCDGQLIAAAEEERFTPKKHDYEFPQNAIDFCLKAGGLAATDLITYRFSKSHLSSLNGATKACKPFRARTAFSGGNDHVVGISSDQNADSKRLG
jgi:predicted NodU family carbamoyl transferase